MMTFPLESSCTERESEESENGAMDLTGNHRVIIRNRQEEKKHRPESDKHEWR